MPKKQPELAGVGQPEIKEIDEAAEAYVKARDTRMKWLEKEIEAKDTLTNLMHEHNLTAYRFEDGEKVEREVKLESKEKLTVRVPKAEGEGEEEESEKSED